MPRSIGKQRIMMSLGLILSAVLLFLFLRRVDLGQLASTLASVNLWILSLCVITKGGVLSLNALRTKVLLRPLRHYRFSESLASWLGGFVTNNILPFRLGELVRMELLTRTGQLSRGSTIAIVALERLVDLASFLVLFSVAVPLLAIDLSDDARVAWVLGAVLIAFSGVLWLATNPSVFPRLVVFFTRPLSKRLQAWVFEKAQRFVDGFSALRSSRAVVESLALTFLVRLVGMLTIQCWFWAFGLNLPLYAPLIVTVFLSIGTMVPSSPGFIGTFHVACAYALELMGVEPAMAASIAIAGHFMATVPWTIIGLFVALPTIRSVWKRNKGASAPVADALGA
jgi:uncharacterized protein (TIRG00374 family)